MPADKGFFLGRFQPPHMGHTSVINEIMLDGLKPVILLGSTNIPISARNPLTTIQRTELWQLVYPGIEVIPTLDNPDNEIWAESLTSIIGNGTIYFHDKPEDRSTFVYKGVEFVDAHYIVILQHEGVKTKSLTLAERKDIKINASATNIREDLEAFKHLLDARVYFKLKEFGW
jgi:hypothetical protein